MTWRFEIRHVSGYQYVSPVRSSYNEVRITPLTTATQLTVESKVEIQPATRSYRYWDYWGALVDAFDIHVPHTELVVTGTSIVETSDLVPWTPETGWEELSEPRCEDLVEYLMPSRYVPLGPELTVVASALRAAEGPAQTVAAVASWVHSTMSYQPGTTHVSTSATEALAHRRGVCQDFVHVFLGLVRTLGIPARYVSGYLHPAVEPAVGVPERGQSHAWAEVWAGGWVPFDPTNGETPGPRHVVVAHGRDYGDVAPLRGIYSGGSAHALDVVVELTRLA